MGAVELLPLPLLLTGTDALGCACAAGGVKGLPPLARREEFKVAEAAMMEEEEGGEEGEEWGWGWG